MTNLPAERPESTPALLGGQAALFDNPTMLLDLDDVALKELAVLFGRHGASVFAQVRAQAGLLAWAGWFRFGEVTYSAFLLGLSKDLGVQPDTLMKWRRDVVRERRLPVPGVVKARSDAAKEGHKTAGQTSGAGRSSGKSKPIPATSKEVPAESPEGLDQSGLHRAGQRADEPSGAVSANDPPTPSGPSSADASSRQGPPSDPPASTPSADPSSGGAGIQPPPRPTGDPTSPLPAPPGPPERPSRSAPESYIIELDADVDGLRWLQSKTDRQVRALADPLGGAIRAEVRRWAIAFGYAKGGELAPPAPAEKPQRRQGTITRPADRAPKPPVTRAEKARLGTVNGSLTRRDVTPMFKP